MALVPDANAANQGNHGVDYSKIITLSTRLLDLQKQTAIAAADLHNALVSMANQLGPGSAQNVSHQPGPTLPQQPPPNMNQQPVPAFTQQLDRNPPQQLGQDALQSPSVTTHVR